MNLYRITQIVNNDYDTYDSAIVAAESEDDARNMHPNFDFSCPDYIPEATYWAEPKDVHAEFIGVAAEGIERSVILASFNAG